jgi:hypothetical protein
MEGNYQSFEACIVTNIIGGGRVCLHHIHTRKSHPEFSECIWNMIPVSLIAHNEFHNKGTTYMANKYASVKLWLIQNNWYICPFRNKWVHDP